MAKCMVAFSKLYDHMNVELKLYHISCSDDCNGMPFILLLSFFANFPAVIFFLL
jgi:hypothetical protein